MILHGTDLCEAGSRCHRGRSDAAVVGVTQYIVLWVVGNQRLGGELRIGILYATGDVAYHPPR